MKSFFVLFLFFATAAFGFDKLRIYSDVRPEVPYYQTSDYAQIVPVLNAIGVRFEKWEANKFLPEDAKEEAVFEAYREDIERLKRENNYPTVDIVRMVPNSPKKVDLRNKFLNEHTHTEDEVRFFVEGSGLFYLHVHNLVFIVLCEKGDLISIPANYAHWFDMGTAPYFTAIRFFMDPSGWIANFTNSQISEQFPRFEEGAQ